MASEGESEQLFRVIMSAAGGTTAVKETWATMQKALGAVNGQYATEGSLKVTFEGRAGSYERPG
jgi:hypothetical protein